MATDEQQFVMNLRRNFQPLVSFRPKSGAYQISYSPVRWVISLEKSVNVVKWNMARGIIEV